MTETQTFDFELVSPEEKLISEPAHMVVIPGEEGDFGVMPNHSALVSSIRIGVIEIFANDNDSEPRRVFVSGGFADVTETNCTILAEEAIDVKDLSKDDLDQEIRNLTEDFGLAENEADKAHIEKKLLLTKAKLAAVVGGVILS